MRIATLFGVPVRVHWTFLAMLLLLAIFVPSAQILPLFGVIGILALIVLAHEFGHVLAARRYGVRTLDVVLTPLGGIARLSNLPERPKAEIVVALAGPAVNFVLALLVLPIVILDPATAPLGQPMQWGVAQWFVTINVVLGTFNLLPAFPMDGGRVLRGLLSMRRGRVEATEIAVAVGRVVAVVMGIAGLFGNLWLLFIAVFVWIVGGLELHQVRMLEAYRRMQQAGAGAVALPPHLAQLFRLMGIDPRSVAGRTVQRPGGTHASDPPAGYRQPPTTHDVDPFGRSQFGGFVRGTSASAAHPYRDAPRQGPQDSSYESTASGGNGQRPGDAPSAKSRPVRIEVIDIRANRKSPNGE